MKKTTIAFILGLVLAGGFSVRAAGTILFPQGGGTGQNTLTSSQLLYGAGTNPVQTVATSSPTFSSPLTTSGTAGYLVGGSGFTISVQAASGAQNGYLSSADYSLLHTATTTAGTGLSYSGNAFNVNTSQNISTLSNLTTNGFVKTSGGTGALSIDTNTYLTSAVTSLAQTYGTAQTGAITLATSTTAISNDWGITNSSGTFTFNIPSSSASVRGLLTSTDWTTFNNKLSTADAFTHTTNFGQNASATTSQLWLQGNFSGGIPSLSASSTANLSTTTIYAQSDDGFKVVSQASNHIALFQNTTSGSAHASFCNSVTGCTTADGTDYGIDPSGNARILNHEASGFRLLVNQSVEAIDALLNGLVGVGTTTPASAQMVIASSTGPQIALTGSGNHLWNIREAGGYLYFATSSPTTYATSSATALTINQNGYIGIASNSPSDIFVVGSGIVAFLVKAAGEIIGYDQTNGWNGRISPTHSLVLQEATTTTWTGTSTGPYMGEVILPFAGTARSISCYTFGSFLDWSLSGAFSKYIVGASSTIGTFALSNTFTANSVLYFQAGTTTTATATSTTCTLQVTENI